VDGWRGEGWMGEGVGVDGMNGVGVIVWMGWMGKGRKNEWVSGGGWRVGSWGVRVEG
jgi:hypothetical protein